MADADTGIYRGRLMCDGQGNLLADESKRVGDRLAQVYDGDGNEILVDGEPLVVSQPVFRYGSNHGRPVALHEGSYVFLNAGEDSHNERHHKQFATIDGTQSADPERDSYAGGGPGDKDAKPGTEHHWAVPEDDPHYDSDTDNNTRLRYSPDKVAATETSHTDAYEGKHEVGDTA